MVFIKLNTVLFVALSIVAPTLMAQKQVPWPPKQSDGRARASAPNHDDVIAYRNAGLWADKAQAAIDAGDYAKAELFARQSAVFIPDEQNFHVFRSRQILGEALLRQGKNQDALDTLKLLFKRNPEPYVLTRIGLLLARLGNLSESRELWNSKFATYWFGSEEQEGKLFPANLDRADLEGSWLLQTALIESANDPVAHYYLRKAATLIPRNPLLEWKLGNALFEGHKFKEAVSALKIASSGLDGVWKTIAARQLEEAKWRLQLEQKK